MTALVLLALGALVVIHWLAHYTHRPTTMSTTWLAQLHHRKDDAE